MRYRLLGRLEVIADDGRTLAFANDRQRIVLEALLFEANRVVSTARLINALWSENPPSRAGNALRVHVSRVRRNLAGQSAGEVLPTDPSRLCPRLMLAQDRAGRQAGAARGLLPHARHPGRPAGHRPQADPARSRLRDPRPVARVGHAAPSAGGDTLRSAARPHRFSRAHRHREVGRATSGVGQRTLRSAAARSSPPGSRSRRSAAWPEGRYRV